MMKKSLKHYRPETITFTWKRGYLIVNQQMLEEMPDARRKRLMTLIHKAMREE